MLDKDRLISAAPSSCDSNDGIQRRAHSMALVQDVHNSREQASARCSGSAVVCAGQEGGIFERPATRRREAEQDMEV